jgi:uncharacterized protein involved in cysteine biosynthesis|tara:strand:+ start:1660 stop:2001 length:342 start_codon:yes stop_codon:yes gene_type:complete
MKKTLLLLLCLLSWNTFTYASFPITENSASDISNSISFQVDEDEPSLLVYILRGILVFSILGFGLYFLIRAWLRAWRDNVRWVKVLTYIVLAALLLILLFALLLSSIGYGYGN